MAKFELLTKWLQGMEFGALGVTNFIRFALQHTAKKILIIKGLTYTQLGW